MDKSRKGHFFAVPGKRTSDAMAAEASWMADNAQSKFVPLEPATLECQSDPGM